MAVPLQYCTPLQHGHGRPASSTEPPLLLPSSSSPASERTHHMCESQTACLGQVQAEDGPQRAARSEHPRPCADTGSEEQRERQEVRPAGTQSPSSGSLLGSSQRWLAGANPPTPSRPRSTMAYVTTGSLGTLSAHLVQPPQTANDAPQKVTPLGRDGLQGEHD